MSVPLELLLGVVIGMLIVLSVLVSVLLVCRRGTRTPSSDPRQEQCRPPQAPPGGDRPRHRTMLG
jgi:hypothetical protein